MLRVYNTLTRKIAEISPLEPGKVGMYTCGPTVYRDAHIGNLRSFMMADWLRRSLEFQGIDVTHVKNITDVGHMRQEALEQGGDKIINEALARGMKPQEIAQYYTNRFLREERKLNILPATHYPRATNHIVEMIEIIDNLVQSGHAYHVEGNIYFDVASFENYGELSGNTIGQSLQEAVRIETDPLKRNPRDFALWKLGEHGRDLVWNSPWGSGFPGWHIECSAMSIKYLGQKFDIHTGGVDNIFPHHEDEIAQSNGFVGKSVVTTWVHGQHLLADGVKMSKSTGNSFTLSDIESKGIDPLAFRYLCLTSKYNNRLDFTFRSLKAAQRGLLKLQNRVWELGEFTRTKDTTEVTFENWESKFLEYINNNLDLPRALGLCWRLLHSSLPQKTKLTALLRFDEILGLGLANVSNTYEVSEDIRGYVLHRNTHREKGEYEKADAHKDEIYHKGFVIQDTQSDTLIRPKTAWEKLEPGWPSVSSSVEIESQLGQPDKVDFTIGIVARNFVGDLQRCLDSAFKWGGHLSIEAIVVNNGSTDDTASWLETISKKDRRISVTHTDHILGEASARNIILRQSRGSTIIMLETSTEITGNIFEPIDSILEDKSIGVAGPFGLKSSDLRHFHDSKDRTGDMDAMQAYCFAFRRSRLSIVGFMRESFRFYRNLDIDYSFHFKDKGYRIFADPRLPVELHEHRVWTELSENERDDLSRKNFGRFLNKWGARLDLVVSNIPPHQQD